MSQSPELAEIESSLDRYLPDCLRLDYGRTGEDWVPLLDLALYEAETIDRGLRQVLRGAHDPTADESVTGVVPAGARLVSRGQIPEYEPGGYIWGTLADFYVPETPRLGFSIACSIGSSWQSGNFQATLGALMIVRADVLATHDVGARQSRYEAIVGLLERAAPLIGSQGGRQPRAIGRSTDSVIR